MKRDVFPILYARDLPGSIRSYRDLIGMTESYRFPKEGEPAYVTLAWGTGSLGIATYDVTPGLRSARSTIAQGGQPVSSFVSTYPMWTPCWRV